MQNSFGGAPMASIASTPPPPVQRKRGHQATADLSNVEVIALSPDTIIGKHQFTCEICNKGFSREQNLQLHRRVHNLPWELTKKQNRSNSEQSGQEKVYVCPVSTCARNDPHTPLGDLGSLRKHYSRKHCDKNLKCAMCNKSYAVDADLKAHQKACGHNKYKCDCGSSFSRRSSLRIHETICNVSAQQSTQTSAPQNSFTITGATSRNLLEPSKVRVCGFHPPKNTPALNAATNFRGDSSINAYLGNNDSNCGTTVPILSNDLSNNYSKLPTSGLNQFDQENSGPIFSASNVGGNLPYSSNSLTEQFTSSNLHFSIHVDDNTSFPYTTGVQAPIGSHRIAMPPLNNNIPTGHYSNLLSSINEFDSRKFYCPNGRNDIFGQSPKSTMSDSEVNIFDISYLYDNFLASPNPEPSKEPQRQGFISDNSNMSEFVTRSIGNSSGLMNSNFNCAATEPQQGFISINSSTLGEFGNSTATAIDSGVDNFYFPTFGNTGSYEAQTNYLGYYGNTITCNVVNHKYQLGGEAGFGNGARAG